MRHRPKEMNTYPGWLGSGLGSSKRIWNVLLWEGGLERPAKPQANIGKVGENGRMDNFFGRKIDIFNLEGGKSRAEITGSWVNKKTNNYSYEGDGCENRFYDFLWIIKPNSV